MRFILSLVKMSGIIRAKQGTKHKSEQERRAQILDCSMEMFISNGYHKTTMKEIMASTELSKGAIYHYFSSKEEIFIGIVREFEVHLRLNFATIITSNDPIPDVKNLIYTNLDELIRLYRMSIVCLEISENHVVKQIFDGMSSYIRESTTIAIKSKYSHLSEEYVDDVVSSFYLMMEGLFSLAATDMLFNARNELAKVFRVVDCLLGMSKTN